ncbi:hypothetical protein A2U01_0109211, partial [Trifolium medium]|nr:hypothetical protein [Trifolium medium]
DQETGNAESPPKENDIPEIIPKVDPVVEVVKNVGVMSESKGPEVLAVDPSSASKDKTSSSTNGINWEEMVS